LRGPSVSEAPRSALRECRDWGLGECGATGLRYHRPLDLSTSRTTGLPDSARSATHEPRTESVGLRTSALSCQRTTEPSDCRTLESSVSSELQTYRRQGPTSELLRSWSNGLRQTPRVCACGTDGPTHFVRLALRDCHSPKLSDSRAAGLTNRRAGELSEPGSSADRYSETFKVAESAGHWLTVTIELTGGARRDACCHSGAPT